LHAKSWHVAGITRKMTAADWAAAQVEHVREIRPAGWG
jgi:hypothetical protein